MVRHRRQSLGLSEAEVAARVGVSVSAYGDAETYEHELLEQFSLAKAQRLCQALSIDPCDLYGLKGQGIRCHKKLSAIISEARKGLGLSVVEVGQRLGYDEWAIRSMEDDDTFLNEKCSVQTALNLANILEIEPCTFFQRE